MERGRIDFARESGVSHQCLDLGAEEKSSRGLRVVKGFDAQMIASEEKRATLHTNWTTRGSCIMDREGKNPVQLIEHVKAIAFIKMKKHLGVGG